jgi:ABC-type Na+ efflux pump permease subunit
VVNFADLAGSNPTTYEFLYATIVPLLLFFPGFVAGSMVVDSITSEFEHQTLEMLQAAPLSMNQIIGSKIAAAVVLALAQVVLWLFLLRFNGVELSHAGPVLLLGMTVAGLNGVGAGLIATIFKDRERAQLMYSMAILVAVSASYMTGRSPLTLLVQLASGDYYAGWSDVALYLVLLLGLVGALFASTPRLMRLKF